uniref:AlNc14C360G10979 protein n=1 Tax=Albugo laibachii Nc14 TaxID=890382 RepID=F0WXP4_9STRA|nr:AlNc14C360G10979 [Albugo laibachii Nc14]|eukprot:CCA26239.1 AlNc14C360G10979 [Albugo laibachii Nc14]
MRIKICLQYIVTVFQLFVRSVYRLQSLDTFISIWSLNSSPFVWHLNPLFTTLGLNFDKGFHVHLIASDRVGCSIENMHMLHSCSRHLAKWKLDNNMQLHAPPASIITHWRVCQLREEYPLKTFTDPAAQCCVVLNDAEVDLPKSFGFRNLAFFLTATDFAFFRGF